MFTYILCYKFIFSQYKSHFYNKKIYVLQLKLKTIFYKFRKAYNWNVNLRFKEFVSFKGVHMQVYQFKNNNDTLPGKLYMYDFN